MAKKRKTKEQKIIAELRRKLTSQVSPTKSVSPPDERLKTKDQRLISSPRLPAFQIPVVKTQDSLKILTQHDYSYLSGDLKKVGILTGLAILLQGVLYLLLRA